MPRLEDLFDSLAAVPQHALPPVEQWSPTVVGDIDIVIQADGSWIHEGGLIKRMKLVKLFASIMLCEDGQHYLVTPAEKLRITVEDAPLIIVESLQTEEQGVACIVGRTNLDEAFTLNQQHHLEIRNDIPYQYIRRGLWAKVSRNVYYQWAEWSEQRSSEEGADCLALQSAGDWHPIGHL